MPNSGEIGNVIQTYCMPNSGEIGNVIQTYCMPVRARSGGALPMNHPQQVTLSLYNEHQYCQQFYLMQGKGWYCAV